MWTKLQAKIYNFLPSFLKRPTNNLRVLPYYVSWYLHPKGRNHTKKLFAPYKGKFANCRCVVIGNGPSLNKMDLSILEEEFTFGLNRIYLLFDELGFETSFLVSVNGLVMKQFADEIKDVKCLKIFNWIHREKYQANDKTAFLCSKPFTKMNGKILNGYFTGSGTVTNIALEIAYFLGFSQVILIGVDHTYEEKGEPGMPVESEGEDRNHFSPNYFADGTIWQLPNYKTMEFGYKQIKKLFESDNREVVDATKGGKLDIFPKTDFDRVLARGLYRKKSEMSQSLLP